MRKYSRPRFNCENFYTTNLTMATVLKVAEQQKDKTHFLLIYCRSHGVMGIKTCPIGNRSWGLACGTAKKLSSGSTFLNALGRKHNLFKEGDAVGVLLDLNQHKMAFYRNREPLGLQFNDVYGPVIPAISFCRNKTLTLQFPPPPEDVGRKMSQTTIITTTPSTPSEIKATVQISVNE